ncbi:MAG TPA: hypothetical protein VNN12_01725 [Dehalococcoidia bacterium]|nr:hypothetical protein [Dehalococcoidia bacterium]
MRAVLRAAVVLLAFAALATSPALAAKGGKPSVRLSYHVYALADGSRVVDYAVERTGAGGADLAVSHRCVLDGTLVQDRLNRLYWSGPGDKTGHWTTAVIPGSACTAVVVDLTRPVSETSSASGPGYVEVSAPVSYQVE